MKESPRRLLLVMGLAAVPLLPALWVGFLADDFVGAVLLRQKGWRFALSQLWPGTGEFLRPLSIAFFVLEGKVLGLRPAALHAVHLLLFLAVAWLASRLASRLAGGSAAPWAILFVLWYPAHAEAHLWIAGLFDLLAALFVVAGLFLALPGPGGAARRGTVAAAFAAGFLAPLAKEVGWAFPIVIAIWWPMGLLPLRPRGTARKIVTAAFAGALLTVVYRLAALGGTGGYQDTASRIVEGLVSLPAVLLHATLLPANPSFGGWSVGINAACAAAALALVAVCLLHPKRGSAGARLILAGLTMAVATLLPTLPYLDATVFWRNSRYLTLPGIGLALTAAGCAGGGGRLRTIAGWSLGASWLAALILATIPWLQAARARDTILVTIGEVTRAQGTQIVWFKGSIGELRGVHLLGGHLQWAVRYCFPGRKIEADSEAFQRYRGSRPAPPCQQSGQSCHLLEFLPDPPRVHEMSSMSP
ncbi:MAG: hypothetical protein GXP47_15315 [Acidobacteria bacterium]|nr:hypothetical protein [Acidobacteriota bacterium]